MTGERIREKVAASKRKGMWMGGNVPLGYAVSGRKLAIVGTEAEAVRLIYERYLAVASIAILAGELENRGIRSKPRIDSDGTDRGSRTLSRGAIAHILKNRLYLGEITHKGEVFEGEHPVIVNRAIWDRVQALITANRTNDKASTSGHCSLLVGRIRNEEGRAMVPVHANKQGRRYRYYVTRPDPTGRRSDSDWRLPAGEIDQLVVDSIAAFLRDANAFAGLAPMDQPLPLVIEAAATFATKVTDAESSARTVAELDLAVTIEEQLISIDISLEEVTGEPKRHAIIVPARLTRRGHELRLAYPPADHRAQAEPDVKLVGLIAKAEAAHRELIETDKTTKTRRAHLTRLARLRTLAPDIVAAILDGRHPVELSARKLLRAEMIPLEWSEQRRALGFA